MSRPSLPDLYVSIDFGTTYTGVAWTIPKLYETSKYFLITEWPGIAPHELKVPTVLVKDEGRRNTRWGFLCDGAPEGQKWRFFKLFLDPEEFARQHACFVSYAPKDVDQACELVAQYLEQIYTYISHKITELIRRSASFVPALRGRNWDELEVEFIFSVPTTWEAPVSHTFRDAVRNAGFGNVAGHSVMLGLTEADAAAVLAANSRAIYEDDIILSIDAGGGTTDLAFIKVEAHQPNSLTLDEVLPVAGIGVGSIMIDAMFKDLVDDQLKNHPEARSFLPTDFSWRASQGSGFQIRKRAFGIGGFVPKYDIEMPKEFQSYDNPDVGIQQGYLDLKKEQLQGYFDAQLELIKGLIEMALDRFEAKRGGNGKNRLLNYVALSGGLGSSRYVFQQLEIYFRRLAAQRQCAAGTKFLKPNGDARTAVVRGLLHNRINESTPHALRQHIARGSYGVLVKQPRSDRSGFKLSIRRDPSDETPSRTHQIHWLVKAGELITNDDPRWLTTSKRLSASDPRMWIQKVVWRGGERQNLPSRAGEGRDDVGIVELQSVRVEVRKGTKLKPKWEFPSLAPTHHICDFDLGLVVGPSGDCQLRVSDNLVILSE